MQEELINLNINDFIEADELIKEEKDQKKLSLYMLFWSIMLIIAGILAAIITKEGIKVIDNLLLLWLSPAKLVTDYFNLGSLGAAFLNAGLCGLGCNLMIFLTKAKKSSTLLAGYFLVIAHCFYGLNFLNMWLPFLSIFLYALMSKKRLGDVLHLSMFATSLGPFISDFLFRYTLGDNFVFGSPKVTLVGIIIAVIFSIIAAFLIPALVNGVTKMHRGYNLYKAGVAIGLFGFFAFALFYKSFNISTPDTLIRNNDYYETHKNLHYLFSISFFFIMFILSFIIGLKGNKWTLKGYEKLWKCDGWRDDFPIKFGMPLTIMNIGIYGMGLLVYYIVIMLLTNGTGFSGPTTGAIIAAITFSASGQTIRNVWPIACGYVIFSLFLYFQLFYQTHLKYSYEY